MVWGAEPKRIDVIRLGGYAQWPSVLRRAVDTDVVTGLTTEQ